jgi:UDP-2,3-diacylglucosamine pyrophosphatase LpxH
MCLLFCSDIHLDFFRTPDKAKVFGDCLANEKPDAEGLIIAGDISIASKLEEHLIQLYSGFKKPIYFVLGNHDFWTSSFKEVNKKVLTLTKKIPDLHWLQNEGPIKFETFDMVGVSGWYDAYYGNTKSTIALNDWYSIIELMPGVSYRDLLIQLIREEAGKQADVLYKQLKNTTANTIIIVTHVPPYKEASWHEGEMSDYNTWLPWMSSASTGAVIDRYAEANPDKSIVVITGHTHSPGIYQKKNVTVYTTKAIYGAPDITGKLYKDKIITLNHIENVVERKL